MANIINKINVSNTEYELRANTYVGSCTAAISTNTAVTCSEFPGNAAGTEIVITFTNAIGASVAAGLNVNSKGALPVYANGKAIDYSWAAGATVSFICDGTHWVVQSDSRVMSSGAASSKPTSGVKGQIYFVV